MITGGFDKSLSERGLKTVTRYSRTGEAETLPELNVVRWFHACGSYLTDEGDNVRFILNISKYTELLPCRYSLLLEVIITQEDTPPMTPPKFWRTWPGPGD